MKRLYLIRHAKSDWSNPFQSDFDRPLNHRGEKNAPFMGSCLADKHIHPDLILSSPAVRARMTAEAIGSQIGYDIKTIVYVPDLYLADIRTIEKVLRNVPDTTDTAFLVAHNPGLTLFAEYISAYTIDNIPTCGVFEVELRENTWNSVGEKTASYVSFDYPKRHKHS